MTPEQARAAAEEILSKFGKVHDHWAEVCAAIILKHAESALASPAPPPTPPLEWNPQVEVYRKALMEKFADTIPMDRISNAAYILAEDYKGDVRVQIEPVEAALVNRPPEGKPEVADVGEVEVPPAPELLEALERAVKRGCACLSSNEDDWHADACPIPKMTAAIRKARGEAK